MAPITLNVGGQVMKTKLTTLTKYPGTKLRKMFTRTDSNLLPLKTVNGDEVQYFLDFDPEDFRVILNFLRIGEAAIRKPNVPESVSALADYLGLKEIMFGNDEEIFDEKWEEFKYVATVCGNWFKEPRNCCWKHVDDLLEDPNLSTVGEEFSSILAKFKSTSLEDVKKMGSFRKSYFKQIETTLKDLIECDPDKLKSSFSSDHSNCIDTVSTMRGKNANKVASSSVPEPPRANLTTSSRPVTSTSSIPPLRSSEGSSGSMGTLGLVGLNLNGSTKPLLPPGSLGTLGYVAPSGSMSSFDSMGINGPMTMGPPRSMGSIGANAGLSPPLLPSGSLGPLGSVAPSGSMGSFGSKAINGPMTVDPPRSMGSFDAYAGLLQPKRPCVNLLQEPMNLSSTSTSTGTNFSKRPLSPIGHRTGNLGTHNSQPTTRQGAKLFPSAPVMSSGGGLNSFGSLGLSESLGTSRSTIAPIGLGTSRPMSSSVSTDLFGPINGPLFSYAPNAQVDPCLAAPLNPTVPSGPIGDYDTVFLRSERKSSLSGPAKTIGSEDSNSMVLTDCFSLGPKAEKKTRTVPMPGSTQSSTTDGKKDESNGEEDQWSPLSRSSTKSSSSSESFERIEDYFFE